MKKQKQTRLKIYCLLFQLLFTIKGELILQNKVSMIKLQNEIDLFVDQLLSQHFRDCSIVHIQNQNPYAEEDGELRAESLPATEININLSFLSRQSSFCDNFHMTHIARHSRQCRIYIINRPISHINEITELFTHPALQGQTHQSYIFLLSQSHTIAEQILLSPNLYNFKHRVWLQIPHHDQAEKFKLKHFYFCYTCGENAKPNLVPGYKFDFKSLRTLFPDVTKNLNRYTLICTAPQAPPLVAILNTKEKIGKEVVGMQAIILKEMAKKMNFTFVLKRASGGATGIPLPNGSWTGIMGEILSNEADIGISVSTSYERNKILDFTVPVFHAFLVLVSVKPLPHFDWEAIFYPFDKLAWTAILCTTFLTFLSFKLLHNKAIRRKSKSEKISFFQSAYLAFGALLEQGVPIKFTTTASRVYAGFWFLLAIVVTCAYRSKLFMFLTFPTIEKPPSSLQELSVSDYSWGMKSLGGVGLLLITESPLAYSRHIGKHMELSFDKYSCLDKTFTHRYVCIIYRAYIDYMAVVRYWKVNHKFHISDYVTSSVGSSWVLPKYSPLLPVLDQYHFSQFEMGLANKYLDKYQQIVGMEARALAQVSNSSEDVFSINTNYVRDVDGPKPLQFENLGGGFFILVAGLVLAIATFLVELIRNYYVKAIIVTIRAFRKYRKRQVHARTVRWKM